MLRILEPDADVRPVGKRPFGDRVPGEPLPVGRPAARQEAAAMCRKWWSRSDHSADLREPARRVVHLGIYAYGERFALYLDQ